MIMRATVEPVFESVTVNADTSLAFDIFSNGIDRWWPTALRIGAGHAFRRLIVEPSRGGRWYAILDNGSEYPIARILEWEPPRRILFAWELNAQWRRNPELATEVEVRFISQGKALTRTGASRVRLSRTCRWPSVARSRGGRGGQLSLKLMRKL